MVSLLDIFQLETMGDQRGGIDLACFDEGENFGAVTAVDTASFEDQVLAVHFRQGQGLGLVVEGHHRDDGIGPGAFPGQTKGILCACHFRTTSAPP